MKNKQKYSEVDASLALYLFQKKTKRGIVKFLSIVLILGLCFTIVYPILSLVPIIFSTVEDLGNPNVIWIPEEFSTISFKAAVRLVMPQGFMTMLKSILYAVGIMILQVFFSAMVGYSLARVKFWGRGLVFGMVILVFLIPRQSLLLAQYIDFVHFNPLGIMKLFTAAGEVNLINNPIVLIMLAIFGFGVNQSLFIFLFSQFFKNIPKELEEASLIDGCGFYRTYFRIMLPNAVPIISTVAILSFVWNYGDTYFTNYFNPNGSYMSTLLSSTFITANKDYILRALTTWYEVPVATDLAFDAVKQAGVLIFLVPLLIVYLVGQRKLVENMENSGLVG
ncbi:MAG: carbohydrate ABC transporter permease [Lachnospiraceae bacterium]|nr:carbohydrate ABC transporter permease [Lachnospiraceae bacterium]